MENNARLSIETFISLTKQIPIGFNERVSPTTTVEGEYVSGSFGAGGSTIII